MLAWHVATSGWSDPLFKVSILRAYNNDNNFNNDNNVYNNAYKNDNNFNNWIFSHTAHLFFTRKFQQPFCNIFPLSANYGTIIVANWSSNEKLTAKHPWKRLNIKKVTMAKPPHHIFLPFLQRLRFWDITTVGICHLRWTNLWFYLRKSMQRTESKNAFISKQKQELRLFWPIVFDMILKNIIWSIMVNPSNKLECLGV